MTDHSTYTYAGVEVEHDPISNSTRVVVPDGTLVKYAGTGVQVNSSRDDVVGQAHVTVNTEEAPARDVLASGSPALEVSLNDATLYDREPESIGYVMAVVHRVVPRPGESFAEAWDRTNLGTVDGRDVDALKEVLESLKRWVPLNRTAHTTDKLQEIIDRGAPTETLFATGVLACPMARIEDPDFDVSVSIGTTFESGPAMVRLGAIGDEEVVPVPTSATFRASISIPADVGVQAVLDAISAAGAVVVDAREGE